MGGELVKFIRGEKEQIAKNWRNKPDGSIIVCTDHPRLYIKLDGKLLPMSPAIEEIEDAIKMKPRTCVKCGAPLEVNKDGFESVLIYCPYCKTSYDIDSSSLNHPLE